jgi:sec-independent protein translocase protein TatA
MLLLSVHYYFLSLFAPEHLMLIAFVVLLLFGGKKIPDLMRGMGKGIREFNDAKSGIQKEIEEGIKEKENTVAPITAAPHE